MDHAAAAPAHGGPVSLTADTYYDHRAAYDRARLGMWMFLASEIMMFGAFIAAYTILRLANPNVFSGDYIWNVLSWKVGALNTAVLIASSFTMVLAVKAIRENNRGMCSAMLGATGALGAVFLVIKIIFEYLHDFHLGIYPDTSVYWSAYFLLTGFHGLHVLLGVIYLWGIIPFMKHFDSERHAHVELGGLYWHFVDLVWIFLFPLLYLLPITK